VDYNKGAPLLEFLAVNGRTYTLFGSADLKTWKAVMFRIPADGANAAVRRSFQTATVKNVRMEVSMDGSDQPPAYFRLMLE
jgi:hypothetical protein